jgi:murein DD-endopeptidase MepM/ murein hydrolase activator NlpD
VDSFASMALVVIFLAAFNNYRNGTLGDWAKAKFFNQPQKVGGGNWSPSSFTPTSGLSRLLAPVTGIITGIFGEGRGDHRHAGIDYAVPIGTPVKAAAAGRVVAAGAAGGYGLRVDVDHGNGIVTRYAHLDRLGVNIGDVLGAGDTVGRSGNTGESTGPHLHFEVLDHGTAVDPGPYVGAPRRVVT